MKSLQDRMIEDLALMKSPQDRMIEDLALELGLGAIRAWDGLWHIHATPSPQPDDEALHVGTNPMTISFLDGFAAGRAVKRGEVT